MDQKTKAKKTYENFIESLNTSMLCAAQANLAAEECSEEDIWEGNEAMQVATKLKEIYINFCGGKGHETDADEFFKSSPTATKPILVDLSYYKENDDPKFEGQYKTFRDLQTNHWYYESELTKWFTPEQIQSLKNKYK